MPFQALPLEFSAISIALAGAFAYGSGDFMGGRASTRLSPSGAVALAQVTAMLVALHLHAGGSGAPVGVPVIVAGVFGGVCYAVGLTFLYRGIAFGRIGVVAPVCGVVGILVPLAGDVALSRHIGAMQLLGIAVCGLAIVLLAGTPERRDGRRSELSSFRIGLISGMGYGTADLMLGMMSPQEATGGLMVARSVAALIAVSIVAGALLLARAARAEPGGQVPGPVAGRARLLPTAAALSLAMLAGAFDSIGHMSYVHVATQGSMAVASALIALFPAVAVLLAVILLRERITAVQCLGLLASGAGVVGISL